jgi:hypothetical protein
MPSRLDERTVPVYMTSTLANNFYAENNFVVSFTIHNVTSSIVVYIDSIVIFISVVFLKPVDLKYINLGFRKID